MRYKNEVTLLLLDGRCIGRESDVKSGSSKPSPCIPALFPAASFKPWV